MAKTKNQNSILFLTTLGVYLGLVLVGAAPGVSAQSLTRARTIAYDPFIDLDYSVDGPFNCSAPSDKVFKQEVEYLWFNGNSVIEYTRLLEDILKAYPEERIDQTHLSWRSANSERPFRILETAGSDSLWLPVDSETKQDLERDILLLGNGFSAGKSFRLTVDRGPSDFVSRLDINVSGVDAQLASSLYSSALQLNRCQNPTYFEKIVLDRTEISVENNNLIITTRLPRGSLYTLIPSEGK